MTDNKRYRSLNSYFRERFSKKVYKLALSVSNTCPNRDGTLGVGGCIFCSGQGSGDFAESYELSVTQQIERAKLRVAKKTKDAAYCAYFQSFTSTYCSYQKMKAAFYEAAEHPEVVTVSIATRPDCLPTETLELLSEINKIKPVSVELGLQSSNEQTVRFIRRGYDNEVYFSAVKELKKRGISVVTHIILGLPDETEADVLNTLSYAVNAGTDGIKLQLLHILKGTDLLTHYEKGDIRPLELDEYTRLLASCIEHLPENVVVHRLTGDGAKRDLVAPLWSADKKRVLNHINRYFEEHNIIQGKCFKE